MAGGKIWILLLGGAALTLVAVFFASSFEGGDVGTFEASDTSAPAAPSPTATPVLIGPQDDGSIISNPDSLTAFCLELFFAEAACAGVVRELCAEVGSTDPQCIDALAAYCATPNPLLTYCRGVDGP